MTRRIYLDSGPLGLLAHSKEQAEAVQCTAWLRALLAGGANVVLPEIADYEIRRELMRLRSVKGLMRLESLLLVPGVTYRPIDTPTMRLAAKLWADVRSRGKPTADRFALDADVVLAAQALLHEDRDHDVIVATTNVRHLEHFVTTRVWTDIAPEATS